jgi:8-oxo-dGTP pyrophosphatase MutT (NUDIX family)
MSLRSFIVDQRDFRSDEYWTFAKGTPEEGETPLETAIRETKEEVGIEFNSVIEEPSFTTHPYILHNEDGIEIHKLVTYYIGFARTRQFTVEEKEIVKARWCTFEEARDLITYDFTRVIIDKVDTYLRSEFLDK